MAGLTSASFWIDLGERMVRSFAQGTLAGLGLGALGAATATVSLPWPAALEIGATTAGICLLTGLASVPVGDQLTASFLPSPDETPAKLKSLLRLRR